MLRDADEWPTAVRWEPKGQGELVFILMVPCVAQRITNPARYRNVAIPVDIRKPRNVAVLCDGKPRPNSSLGTLEKPRRTQGNRQAAADGRPKVIPNLRRCFRSSFKGKPEARDD